MASPSFSWLLPWSVRRHRTREPTWMSMGLGLSDFWRRLRPSLVLLFIIPRPTGAKVWPLIIHTIVCGQPARACVHSFAAPILESFYGFPLQPGKDPGET